jgi:type I restriction enzyme S subunit
MRNKIKSKLQISKSSWSPQKSHDEYVNYYSIPNFDLGFPKEEKTSEIKSGKFLINQPCILISKLNPGTPRVWLIHDLLSGVNVCSTEFVVLIPNEKLDLKYIYFLLKSNTVTNKLTDMSTGTSNSHQRVRPESILELEVDWNENANERYVLSEFLWGLEQKISTKNAISKNLEDIVQTIFKSWFIDFDPVKAKMNGEKPIGMDDETAALFPDSFEESELGLIPKGWEVKSLGEICSVTLGGLWGSDSESLETPDKYLCVRGVDMDDLKSSGYASRIPMRWEKKHNYEKRLLSSSQVLVAGSGAGPVAKSLLWDQSMNELFQHPVIFSNFVKRFECTTSENASFISSILNVMYESREIFTFVNGTSVPNLQDSELLSVKKIALPSNEVLREFDKLKRNSIKLKYNGENYSLVQIKDSLLPRLISGELQIPEEMLAP